MSLPSMAGRAQSRLKLGLNDYDIRLKTAVALVTRTRSVAFIRTQQMDLTQFVNSSWFAEAKSSGVAVLVSRVFPPWVRKLANGVLLKRAWKLWGYFRSGHLRGFELILATAALFYLVSPIDIIPDFVPLSGFLDDFAVAGLVLTHLERKAKSLDESVTSEPR